MSVNICQWSQIYQRYSCKIPHMCCFFHATSLASIIAHLPGFDWNASSFHVAVQPFRVPWWRWLHMTGVYRSSLHAGEETCRCREPVPWSFESGAAFLRFLAAPFLLCGWAKPRWKDGVPLRSDPTQISAWQRPRGLLAKTKLRPAKRIPLLLKAAAC